MRAADAAAQLIELRQAEFIGAVDDAQVADADQRHVQRAWNRRCRETQNIDQLAKFFEALFVHDAKAVFFVNDDETQIAELDVLLQQAVRANDNIHSALARLL